MCDNLYLFPQESIVKSGADVGQQGLICNQQVLKWGWDLGSLNTLNSSNHVFMDVALCTGAKSYWNRNQLPQTVATMLEESISLERSSQVIYWCSDL